MNLEDSIRAVIDAARMWRSHLSPIHLEENEEDLARAVDALAEAMPKEPNKPYGFVLPRPWNLVPAGWFVKTPNGEWYEVLDTRLVAGKQEVTLRSPAGKTGTFPRDPEGKVSCRRGTHTKELSDAIEALAGAFGAEIVDTSPPWDED